MMSYSLAFYTFQMFNYIWMATLCSLCSITHQFLISDNNTGCPAVCSCSDFSIDCSGRQLINYPNIQGSGKHFYVYLSNNSLTTVPDFAFANISTTKLDIDLSLNLLTSIGIHAFDGLENVTTFLNLGSNNLILLPQALGRLNNLKTLYIWNNPITVFDANVMHTIGLTVETFTMGSAILQHWPGEMHLLRKVKELHINGLALSYLPQSTFRGMELSLESLYIEDMSLVELPSSLCTLRKLRNIDIWDNHGFDSRSVVFQSCIRGPNTNEMAVTMQGNDLLSFPPVFSIFPNASILYVTKNPNLRFIDDELIPNDTHVSLLELYGNGFYQIPAAIMRMKTVRTINLSNNSIATIESNDIQDLPNLRSLFLKDNPIQYISKYAFKNLPSLNSIDLSNTYLTTFPLFISSTMSPLTHLNLQKTRIECNCDFSWLVTVLSNRKINIFGTCESFTEKLQDFINQTLPLCVT